MNPEFRPFVATVILAFALLLSGLAYVVLTIVTSIVESTE